MAAGDERATGVIEAIYVYPAPRAAAVSLAEANALPGVGLREDRPRRAPREVTLLARDAWEAATAAVGRALPPDSRRANLVVSGLPLAAAIGRRLRVGGAVLRICGVTDPCARMDEVAPGLRAALEPECRGGVFGTVEVGGTIAVGDPVGIE